MSKEEKRKDKVVKVIEVFELLHWFKCSENYKWRKWPKCHFWGQSEKRKLEILIEVRLSKTLDARNMWLSSPMPHVRDGKTGIQTGKLGSLAVSVRWCYIFKKRKLP